MIVHKTPAVLKWAYPGLLWKIPADRNIVYLTFDDGPIPGLTPFVLQQLTLFKAQASFFCVGDNVRKHPEIYQKIIQNNHTVGNHTFNHLNGWKTSLDDYLNNVEQCRRVMGDKAKPYFRPPYGRVTREQIRQLQNYTIVMWDVLSGDFSKNISPEKCLKRTLKATTPGSIVVFHDNVKAERNLTYVLPRYLEALSEQGFFFKAL